MGICFLGSFLIFSLFFKPSYFQQLEQQQQKPNTDGFFVSEFFRSMKSPLSMVSSSQASNFSSSSSSSSSSVCSWQGVFCDTQREYVIGLSASGLNLSGPIPDTTIGKLSKLQSLDLSNNKITTLPSDLWSLTSLKTLNLSFNQISGSLPSNIGNFGSLEIFDLSHNNFSGEIPAAISSLLNVQVLKLNRNSFQLSIPQGILNCQSLVSIDLSMNKLNESLPNGFGTSFPKLKSLNLAGNEIYGRDFEFSGLKSLVTLNISKNLFQGSLLGILKQPLEVIDVSKNQFEGHISQVILNPGYNWSSLVHLDLSENQLSGAIFQSLNQARNLKHLNLAFNRFSRQKFPQIDVLWGLEYLNLSKASLIGHIPSGICQSSYLHSLDLSMNHLSGEIPVISIKTLEIIDVSNNNLTGEVPLSVLEKIPYMERFNFSYNNLTLCDSSGLLSPETLNDSFVGLSNNCPIAANPALFKRKQANHVGLMLALALTLSIVCLVCGLLFFAFNCRRKPKMWAVKQNSYKEEQNISGPFSFQTDSTTWVADVKHANSVPVVIFEKPLLNITFSDLLSATSNFDQGTLLAEGKFGPVYRGFLPGGIHVAVKVLVHGSTLTDQEAARELEYLGRIKHQNLVPLTGYCLAGEQRIAIYEYMENGNLQNLLHDLPLGVQTTEDWSTDTWDGDSSGIQNVGSEDISTTWRFRHMIALGTARALAFLHHGCSPPIIHRDIKASSVYLDSNLEPRLSDFGIAKVFGNGLDEEIARGSPSYLPPEFAQPEWESPTTKSDVYCFGVVLFELITGKKPIEDDYNDSEEKESNLVSWVRGLVRKNLGSMAIDPKIRNTGPQNQMEEALKIGYLCTADLPSKRPSMQQIVGLLKDIEPSAKQ